MGCLIVQNCRLHPESVCVLKEGKTDDRRVLTLILWLTSCILSNASVSLRVCGAHILFLIIEAQIHSRGQVKMHYSHKLRHVVIPIFAAFITSNLQFPLLPRHFPAATEPNTSLQPQHIQILLSLFSPLKNKMSTK